MAACGRTNEDRTAKIKEEVGPLTRRDREVVDFTRSRVKNNRGKLTVHRHLLRSIQIHSHLLNCPNPLPAGHIRRRGRRIKSSDATSARAMGEKKIKARASEKKK